MLLLLKMSFEESRFTLETRENRISLPHWKQHSLRRTCIFLHCILASNKYFSISFPFSCFRCSCSRKCHSKNVEILEKLEKTAFLSLSERRRKLKFNLFVHSQTRFLSFSFSFFNKQLPFILTHSISSNQSKSSKSKSGWEKKETKKMNIINNHRTNRKPHSFNARVKRVRTNYTHTTTRFSSIM